MKLFHRAVAAVAPALHTHWFGPAPVDMPQGGDQYTFEHAPCDNGYHTTFIVFWCRCGKYQLFPSSNYSLTTEVFRTETFPAFLKAHQLTEEVE